jgi:hypothetical protein
MLFRHDGCFDDKCKTYLTINGATKIDGCFDDKCKTYLTINGAEIMMDQ